jgi:heme/copper-type cytochrome/quinol oxidase subunit 2
VCLVVPGMVLVVLMVVFFVIVMACHYHHQHHHQDNQTHHQEHQNTLRDPNIGLFNVLVLVLVLIINPTPISAMTAPSQCTSSPPAMPKRNKKGS